VVFSVLHGKISIYDKIKILHSGILALIMHKVIAWLADSSICRFILSSVCGQLWLLLFLLKENPWRKSPILLKVYLFFTSYDAITQLS
jgi:hypothetical protein